MALGPAEGAVRAGTTSEVSADRGRAAAPSHAAAAGRALEYWLRTYRRTWRGSVFSGVLAPVLYLGSLGFGLGRLVDAGASGGPGDVRYALYVAPGVLAANAMQTAVGEATWPVMSAVKWQRTYHAMLATSLGPTDVLLGHLAFVTLRLVLVSAVFAVVAGLLGAFSSVWAVGSVLVAVLVGLAYAAPVMAFAASRETGETFSLLFRFVVIPTFLLAGTFYPVEQLPVAFRPLAWATPLWHGTQASRDLALGSPDLPAVAAHCAYLVCWVVLGLVAGRAVYRRRLVP